MLAPRRFISGDRFSVQIEPERFRQRRYIQPVRVPAPEPEPRSRQVPKVQSPGEQQKSGLPGKTKKTANSSKTQISGNTGS
ncbi:MAG TPA: hypothetical protein VFG39_01490, partial [Balneolaceae bacterium]|nr:hypothetical protein [Balneolaceae bacterium]